MTELILGALLGIVLAARWGYGGTEASAIAAVGAGLAYLASCWRWPYRSCPWCSGKSKAGDGRGNFRLKACWFCGGGRWRRLGARLIGRGA